MMITTAAKSNAIVSSVIPDHLRDRLLGAQEKRIQKHSKHKNLNAFLNDRSQQDESVASPLADLFLETTVLYADIGGKKTAVPIPAMQRLRPLTFLSTDFLCNTRLHRQVYESAAMNLCVFLVPNVPSLHTPHSPFAIAWSSTREPTQVFLPLETLFSSFDQVARKRRILKVETVADCYVAACGLPEPRADNATAMCRFARDILSK